MENLSNDRRSPDYWEILRRSFDENLYLREQICEQNSLQGLTKRMETLERDVEKIKMILESLCR